MNVLRQWLGGPADAVGPLATSFHSKALVLVMSETNSKHQETHPIGELRAALSRRAADLALHLLGEPNRVLSVKSQWRYGKNGSLCINTAGNRAGLWFDHENDEGSDQFGLIMRERRCEFREAVAFARMFLGEVTAPVACWIRPEQLSDSTKLARYLWSQRLPIGRSEAATRYLREARGLCRSRPADNWISSNQGRVRPRDLCASASPRKSNLVMKLKVRAARTAKRGRHERRYPVLRPS
jgi:hypothetical protein